MTVLTRISTVAHPAYRCVEPHARTAERDVLSVGLHTALLHASRFPPRGTALAPRLSEYKPRFSFSSEARMRGDRCVSNCWSRDAFIARIPPVCVEREREMGEYTEPNKWSQRVEVTEFTKFSTMDRDSSWSADRTSAPGSAELDPVMESVSIVCNKHEIQH